MLVISAWHGSTTSATEDKVGDVGRRAPLVGDGTECGSLAEVGDLSVHEVLAEVEGGGRRSCTT